MNEVRSTSYEFAIKRTLLGSHVVMYREAVPDCSQGEWRWGRWRKASWQDMLKFQCDKLR